MPDGREALWCWFYIIDLDERVLSVYMYVLPFPKHENVLTSAVNFVHWKASGKSLISYFCKIIVILDWFQKQGTQWLHVIFTGSLNTTISTLWILRIHVWNKIGLVEMLIHFVLFIHFSHVLYPITAMRNKEGSADKSKLKNCGSQSWKHRQKQALHTCYTKMPATERVINRWVDEVFYHCRHCHCCSLSLPSQCLNIPSGRLGQEDFPTGQVR